MQARLKVAIATAYGGDIMLFDEMLGAGDGKFIAKMEKRLDEMLNAAQCVVVASHSATLLESICERAVWMDNGLVRAAGSIEDVNAAYLKSTQH